MNRRLLALAAVGIVLMSGCSKVTINVNKYDKEIEKNSPLSIHNNQKILGINFDIIKQGVPIAISKDKEYIYVMEEINNNEKEKIIKGADISKVKLLRLNVKLNNNKVTKIIKSKTIADSIPFISSVRWNSSEDIIAFLGENRLTIYNQEKDRLIKQQELKNEPVTYFSWHPTQNIIYTEHPSLVNSLIINLNEENIKHAYETNEQVYYKGYYRKDLYFGTKRYYISDEDAKKSGNDSEIINTVILDKNKNVIKQLPKGRFRDSYNNSIIQTGLSGFGLEYYENINTQENVKILTNEYVYDAKFINNGEVAYITKDTDPSKNTFLLFIANAKGNIVLKQSVLSSSFAILLDGEKGYGSNGEIIHFRTYKIDKKINNINDSKFEELYSTLRGAMDVYYKHEIIGEADFEGAKKYFINTSNPEQWAYFDVLQRFNNIKYRNNSKYYNITVALNDARINNDKASVSLRIGAENSFGSGMGMVNALELIKVNGKWIITGFSTFPDSKKSKELKELIEKEIKNIQDKKLYNGVLTSKNVSIGQIQFWELSEPHLSSDIEIANFCKVYLKVSENNNEVIYKMILDKKYQSNWKLNHLSNEYLWSL